MGYPLISRKILYLRHGPGYSRLTEMEYVHEIQLPSAMEVELRGTAKCPPHCFIVEKMAFGKI